MTTAGRTRQRNAALKQANAVRSGRVLLKREVRDGHIMIGDALIDPRGQGLKVLKLLMAQDRWGEKRAKRLLDGLSISALRTVGDLTDRQREEITVFVTIGQFPSVPAAGSAKHRSLQDYAARKAAVERLRELKLVEQRCKQLGLEANRTAMHVIVRTATGGRWLGDLTDLAFLQAELEEASCAT